MKRSRELKTIACLLMAAIPAGAAGGNNHPIRGFQGGQRWMRGRAVASTKGNRSSVGDGAVAMEWTLLDGHLSGVVLHDVWNGTTVPLPEPFAVVLRDGTKWNAANLRADGATAMQALAPQPNAARAADRTARQQFTLPLT
ncbi:MAG: hypothetical protein WA294_22930, partial [Acidobacteriaceae bacterium]